MIIMYWIMTLLSIVLLVIGCKGLFFSKVPASSDTKQGKSNFVLTLSGVMLLQFSLILLYIS